MKEDVVKDGTAKIYAISAKTLSVWKYIYKVGNELSTCVLEEVVWVVVVVIIVMIVSKVNLVKVVVALKGEKIALWVLIVVEKAVVK